jgi:hypothetical protein
MFGSWHKVKFNSSLQLFWSLCDKNTPPFSENARSAHVLLFFIRLEYVRKKAREWASTTASTGRSEERLPASKNGIARELSRRRSRCAQQNHGEGDDELERGE